MYSIFCDKEIREHTNNFVEFPEIEMDDDEKADLVYLKAIQSLSSGHLSTRLHALEVIMIIVIFIGLSFIYCLHDFILCYFIGTQECIQ
jgi:hypothetical protein